MIEGFLNGDEKLAYKELTNQYKSLNTLLLDEPTRFKRSISQYKRDETDDTYSKVTDTNNTSGNESTSRLTVSGEVTEDNSISCETGVYSQIQNPNDLSEANDNTNILGNDDTNLLPPSDKIPTKPAITSESCNLTTTVFHMSDILSLTGEDESSSYKTLNEIMDDCNNEQKEQPYLHYLDFSSNTPFEILNKEIPDEGSFSSAYVSVECANAQCIQI